MQDDSLWQFPICLSYLEALSPLSGLWNINDSRNSTWSPDVRASSLADRSPRSVHWLQVLLPIICTVGISGNILNLIVLTRKRFCATMGKLERSANMGLTALAFSDLLFCLVVFPNSFIPQSSDHMAPMGHAFVLYYKVYGVSCINIFLMTSTWLIVALAIERNIVLYYPLQAKWLLTLKKTKLILVTIYLLSVFLTLPYFLSKCVTPCVGFDGVRWHEVTPRWSPDSPNARVAEIYNVHIWPIISVFVPLAVLFVCNVRLVQGLRNVPTTRRLKCPGQKIRTINTRITLTLVIIVATALILITPSEILKVINPFKRWGQWGFFVASLANLLQSLNFGFNFILYCAIDRNFRHICRKLTIDRCWPKSHSTVETKVIFFYRPKTASSSVRDPKSSTNGSSRSDINNVCLDMYTV